MQARVWGSGALPWAELRPGFPLEVACALRPGSDCFRLCLLSLVLVECVKPFGILGRKVQ